MNEMPQKSKLAPEIVIEREVPYPPEQVFKAWTDQDALRIWMGPGKVSAPDATMMPASAELTSSPCGDRTAMSRSSAA